MRVCVWQRWEGIWRCRLCVLRHAEFTFMASLQRELSPWRDALPLVRPKGNIYKSSVQQILKMTCRAKLFRRHPCQKCANTPLSLPADPHRVPESVSLTHLADLYFLHTRHSDLLIPTCSLWSVKLPLVPLWSTCKHVVLERWNDPQHPDSVVSALRLSCCCRQIWLTRSCKIDTGVTASNFIMLAAVLFDPESIVLGLNRRPAVWTDSWILNLYP